MQKGERFDHSKVYYPDSDDEDNVLFLKYCVHNNKGHCYHGKTCGFAHSQTEKRYNKHDPLPLDARGLANSYYGYEESEEIACEKCEKLESKVSQLEKQVASLKTLLKNKENDGKEEKYKQEVAKLKEEQKRYIHSLEEATDRYKNLQGKYFDVELLKDKLELKLKSMNSVIEMDNPPSMPKEDPAKSKIREVNEKLVNEIKEIKNRFSKVENFCKEIDTHSKPDDSNGVFAGDYYTAYWDLIDQLKSLVECPLGLIPLETPAILPSGITVEMTFMEKFIDQGAYDPYNKKLKCKKMIINKVAKDVIEIIAKALNSEKLGHIDKK